jgi:hypothetical protein
MMDTDKSRRSKKERTRHSMMRKQSVKKRIRFLQPDFETGSSWKVEISYKTYWKKHENSISGPKIFSLIQSVPYFGFKITNDMVDKKMLILTERQYVGIKSGL